MGESDKQLINEDDTDSFEAMESRCEGLFECHWFKCLGSLEVIDRSLFFWNMCNCTGVIVYTLFKRGSWSIFIKVPLQTRWNAVFTEALIDANSFDLLIYTYVKCNFPLIFFGRLVVCHIFLRCEKVTLPWSYRSSVFSYVHFFVDWKLPWGSQHAISFPR